MHIVVLTLITAAIPLITVHPQPRVSPHPDMRKLEFLIGRWDLEVEGLDRAGNVVHRSRGSWDTARDMGGLILTGSGYSEDGRLAARSWKFRHGVDHRLYDVQFDLAGHFEVRRTGPEEGALAFSLVEPFVGEDGIPRDWRKTYRPLGPDRYLIETDFSEDGGQTWTLAFRERYTRSRDRSDRTPGYLETGGTP